MAAKKKIEFPAECCGVCKFSEPTDAEAYLCWGIPPILINDVWHRGPPVDPQWPACTLFRGRHHA